MPPSPQTISAPLQWRALFASRWAFPLLALAVLLLLLSARRIGSYDLGTHLRAGQWIVQNHAFPAKDVFTYTQNDRDYLDSNGLYQVLLYFMVEAFGYASLTLMNMGVLALVFFLLWKRLQGTGCHPLAACLLLFTALLMAERRFMIRPEIFSWLFLSSTLLVLELRARGRDFLYLLPFLQFFWINTEGLFILGWLVLAVYAVEGRLQGKRWDPKLVRYGLFSLGADLLNPAFLKGMFFPLLLWTRLQGSNLHKQTVVELFSPWRYLQVEKADYDSNLHVFLFFGTASILVILFSLTWRKRRLHELVLTAAFGYMACAAVRNIPLFALVCLPFLAAALRDAVPPGAWSRFSGKKTAWAAALFIALTAARVATNAFYISDRRLERLGLGLDPGRLPIGAADFLSQNRLDGRLLNHLNFGGWLDWRGPQPTFIDGRSEVMEDGFYREYLQSFSPMGLSLLAAHYQSQLILVDYNAAPQWVDQLRHFSDWRLVYLDSCSALYARKDYAPQIPALSFPGFLESRQVPTETGPSSEAQLGDLKPSRFRTWIRGFYRPQTYAMGDFSLGLFALKVGEVEAARNLLMEGFRRTDGDYGEVFYNLAVANLRLGDLELGRRCLEYSGALDPANPAVPQVLKSLPRL